jgi:TIR domain
MDIEVAHSDITQVQADLLVMKHADGFYGADRLVASRIGFNGHVQKGRELFIPAKGLAAPEVLFIGVGPLRDFSYEDMRLFGCRSVQLSREHVRPIKHFALTIHGPGYGLDAEQAFLSMIGGIVSEWSREPSSLIKVTVADRSEDRCNQLRRLLRVQRQKLGLLQGTRRPITIPQRMASSEEPALPGDVFISYRRDDNSHAAGRLFSELSHFMPRERIFMDVDAIPPGADFVDVLGEKVAACGVLLAVIGPDWLDARDATGQRRLDDPNDFVRVEIAAALQRKIPVVPILLDNTPMPRADTLPDELKPLARRNAVPLSHLRFSSDVARLVERLKLAPRQ